MLQGDERAFDAFFDGQFPRLYRFALIRLDHNEDAAEEVAQAALCKAIRKLASYRGEASLSTWLCTFCRYEISDYYRRNKIAVNSVDLIEDNPDVRAALESLGTSADDPDRAFDREEVARLVQATLDRLPRRYGDALEWKYVEGFSVKEIATRLGSSPKAAESLLTRARNAFRDAFSTTMGTVVPWTRPKPQEPS